MIRATRSPEGFPVDAVAITIRPMAKEGESPSSEYRFLELSGPDMRRIVAELSGNRKE